VFTGIVEKTVAIVSARDHAGGRRLMIPNPWNDLKLGQSVAVNGCCLTVAELPPGQVVFDVVAQTLAKTNLGLLAAGSEVHLERPLRVGDRLDGHFVQGHIDGTGKLVDRKSDAAECRLTVWAPAELVKFIMPQGSVALDGVSLTIAAVRDDLFEVALIPTTLVITALGRRAIGWAYNIEVDIVAKTVVFSLERGREVVNTAGGEARE
jgi:riboflavin synthase